ncbi:MAG: hypothetical protein IJ200_04695 [Prevotella sp.]|nr:hypothetical protein [Prevotella sp.]
MKKIFHSMLLFLVAGTSALMVSCKDSDDNGGAAGTDRQFMTMFICDYTRGKGTDYPYNSGIDAGSAHGNDIHLYWYGVKDCAGYQIQMALQPKVSGGAEAWAKIQGTSDLLLNEIVGPDQLDMVINNLQYSTDYRFAIRALSKQDANDINDPTSFAHASNWYGHGNGRQWQEYLGIATRDRYPTPYVVYVRQPETTETTMNVYFNKNERRVGLDLTSEEGQEELASYHENFNIDENGDFQYKYLRVMPSPNNPNSSVGEGWDWYEIKDEDYERGYVTVTGLTPNSVYVIDVIDPTVEVEIDAKYNTCTSRTDGTPGEPILLKHDDLMATQNSAPVPNSDESRAARFALAADYDAAPLSPTLYDFISNTNYAEGQEFWLEGGKTYYIDGNDITCKGFVLRTDPSDVAEGKRAKVICGIGKSSTYDATNGEQWQGSYTCFMFGRQPEAGEGGEIYMKQLAFYDIDFDCPKAFNYGDNQAGAGTVSGNYFFNMYSNGMAVTLDELIVENCTFKRMVRGFIREQGVNYKVWNHVLIKNNQFFDCGYYNQGAGGYCMIAGSGNNKKSNLYVNFECIDNIFYDSPFPAFISEEKEGINWKAGAWNITFANNTLINFNTRASGAIFKMRCLPDGSVYNVKNNLFVLCKQEGDQRALQMWGADIRGTMTKRDGSFGNVTLNFENNWSTNNDLTNGQIFSASPWTATSNNFGKLIKDKLATLNGSLEVQVADVSATELFVNPCPPHKAASANDQNMHRADALDGTASQYNVDLHFKSMDNDIIRNNVGARRWYQ